MAQELPAHGFDPITRSGGLEHGAARRECGRRPRLRFGWTTPILAALVISGCAKIDVMTEVEPDTDFARYHTYFLVSPSDPVNPVIRDRVELELVKSFYARALEPASIETADLLVVFRGSGRARERSDDGEGAGSRTESLQTYSEGTLVVEILDRVSQRRVWRGVATADMTNAKDMELTAARAVKKLFRDFPPGFAEAREARD
jgi:hypothetical protein